MKGTDLKKERKNIEYIKIPEKIREDMVMSLWFYEESLFDTL